jgi:beta-lactamase superfamily II metal-dependent hydrolase
MLLQVFDVAHGQCALITCDNGNRIMIDCGHSNQLKWFPGTYLKGINVTQIELLAITNYDEDHASGLGNLQDHVYVKSLLRNKSVSGNDIKDLKTEDGYGSGIEKLIEMMGTYNGSWSPDNPEPVYDFVERQIFHCSYPEFDDENNLSLVVFLKCHGVGVMFTGDLERAGWLKLLENEVFKKALSETSVFMASHHGRASGCVEEVFEHAKPFYVVISDCGYKYDTQITVPWYRAKAKGGAFRGSQRHVLTTRKDGTISFELHSARLTQSNPFQDRAGLALRPLGNIIPNRLGGLRK